MWYGKTNKKKKREILVYFYEIELIFVSYLGEICSDREIILGDALLQSVRKFGVLVASLAIRFTVFLCSMSRDPDERKYSSDASET
jgi:hypothetical protein